jgi:hypothetical protein
VVVTLTGRQHQSLLDREIWSSKAITFRITSMEPIHPDYLFSICGLTTKLIDKVKDTILQVWKGQASQNLLPSLKQSFPEVTLQQAETTFQNITNSLKVQMLDMKDPGNASAPTFNIYIQANLIPNDGLWCHL